MPTLQQRRLLLSGGPITLVRDTFDRPDSATTLGTADTGQVWVPWSGTWGISSDHAYCASTVSGDYRAAVDSGRTNCTVSVDVTLSPTVNLANPALIVRGVDSANFLMINIYKHGTGTSDVLNLYAAVGNVFTALVTLNSAGNVNGVTYHYVIRASGTQITVVRNGTVMIDYTLTGANAIQFSAATATWVGLRLPVGTGDNGGSSWDNLLVRAA